MPPVVNPAATIPYEIASDIEYAERSMRSFDKCAFKDGRRARRSAHDAVEAYGRVWGKLKGRQPFGLDSCRPYSVCFGLSIPKRLPDDPVIQEDYVRLQPGDWMRVPFRRVVGRVAAVNHARVRVTTAERLSSENRSHSSTYYLNHLYTSCDLVRDTMERIRCACRRRPRRAGRCRGSQSSGSRPRHAARTVLAFAWIIYSNWPTTSMLSCRTRTILIPSCMTK